MRSNGVIVSTMLITPWVSPLARCLLERFFTARVNPWLVHIGVPILEKV